MRATKILKKSYIVILLIVLLNCTGCSALIAAKEINKTDLALVKQGSKKKSIDAQIGEPYFIKHLSDGNIECSYKYYKGKKPDIARSINWIGLDLFLFFIPEIITTPYEIIQIDTEIIKIIYDENENFISIDKNFK